MNRAILAGFGCLTLVAFAIGATLDPVAIKRTPTKGQKISYTMSGKVDVQGMSLDLSAKVTDTVTDVASTGNYTTESAQSDLTFNGMPGPTPSGPTKTVNKPTGEVVSLELPPESSDGGKLQILTQFYYPEKPVNVGDTWTHEGAKGDKLDPTPFKSECKYVGDDMVGTFDTWKVDVDTKETEGDSPTSLHSTVWLDKKDGSMVKVTTAFTNLPVGPVTVNGSMNYMRG